MCQKIADGLRRELLVFLCSPSLRGTSVLVVLHNKFMVQDEECFVLIEQDSFYRNLTPEEALDPSSFNFDHPDAFAFDEMVCCLRDLKNGQPVSIPM